MFYLFKPNTINPKPKARGIRLDTMGLIVTESVFIALEGDKPDSPAYSALIVKLPTSGIVTDFE